MKKKRLLHNVVSFNKITIKTKILSVSDTEDFYFGSFFTVYNATEKTVYENKHNVFE